MSDCLKDKLKLRTFLSVLCAIITMVIIYVMITPSVIRNDRIFLYTQDQPEYYLDGVKTTGTYFSKFDHELMYYVYELDDAGNPIKDSDICKINGISYLVEYYDKNNASNNRVAVGGEITVKNTIVIVSVDLPSTGEKGLERYYLIGDILIFISLLYYAFYYKYFTHSDIHN